MKIALVAFTCLTLGGCAVMNASECRDANWFDVGFRDGDSGQQRWDVLYDHECGKHGVVVDAKAYATGWQDGRWAFEQRTSFGGSMDSE